ncbi:ATP-dependent dethiobiotin synthetase BioD [Streptosporangiaceae bacterium NEAU-GS5]|nr:ATP-dependent dethiobiotin synthetase BioD [Streptosporangiaceae bacterium NEAU-GS5]
MSILVVSGTDTGVGKTVVTAAVAALAAGRGASVAVVKPAQTGVLPGEPGDLHDVVRLTGHPETLATVEYARYPDPLSPAAAARVSGLPTVSLDGVAERISALADRHRLVVVEGAGGLLVRFDEDGWTLADLAHALRAPVLLVARAALGTLNHTALTLEAMAGRGIAPAGVVIGSWPDKPGLAERCNVPDLEMLAARPLAGAIPEGSGALDPAAFAATAARSLAPSLGGTFDPARFRAAALDG